MYAYILTNAYFEINRTSDVRAADLSCSTFIQFCPDYSNKCYDSYNHFITQTNMTAPTQFSFQSLQDFATECLECKTKDYTHGTIIFNAFIFCQVNICTFMYLCIHTFIFIHAHVCICVPICSYANMKSNTNVYFSSFFQLFNEYTARKILDEWNMFEGVQKNNMFLAISLVSLGLQVHILI
jgi:hypothetical protein